MPVTAAFPIMQASSEQVGILYVVATPIGNRADISARAIEVLKAVDFIAAEDTRHSRKLLIPLGIDTPLLAVHEHNERDMVERLLRELRSGRDIALISDAGTPLLSDPGYVLLRAVRAAGIRAVPVPGASALLAALAVAGLPTDRFCFEGFLPAKQVARRERLAALCDVSVTLVFYESSHRIVASLADMAACFGTDRAAVVARELTKTFETVQDGTLAELCAWIEQDSHRQKGEFVVLIHGAADASADLDAQTRHTLEVLAAELPLKQAAALAARISGVARNRLYDYGLVLKDRQQS